MESVAWTEWLPVLALAVALAAAAGLRAWLPLLLAGLLSRAGYLELGESFAFLSSVPALSLFGVATVLEILADKVPALDHALDAISTIVRPAAGALLAASALGVVTDPLTALVLGVAVGAPTAAVPHAAKAALRGASTVLTGGLANPVISAVEDVSAVTLFALAVIVPAVVVLAVIVTAILLGRRLLRRSTVATEPS
jgi:hypothetical protein